MPSGPAAANLPARIVTDPARNAIIYQGSAEEFAQLRPLIESLDQAAREAIIEATVAEVTLTDNETLGAEWVASLGAGPNEIFQNIMTGIGTAAFTFTVLNRAGATRLILNAYVWAATLAALLGIIGYFDLLPGAYDSMTRYGRATGLFKDPNVFGPFLVPGLVYLLSRIAGAPLRRSVPILALMLVI